MSTQSPQKNIHAGHRQRLRSTYLQHGMDVLSDINALEFLLFFAYPRQDTNPIAHRLLDTFGSLDGVFSASVSDLMNLGQLPETAATLIHLVPDLARRQQLSQTPMGAILDTPSKYGDFLLPYFLGARDECIYMLALDSKCKAIDCARLSTGSVNSASLSTRTAVEYALRVKATSVILAHNHTSGIAVPSQEDLQTTRIIAQALATVGVLLADHIVVADGDYISMLESGLPFSGTPTDTIHI